MCERSDPACISDSRSRTAGSTLSPARTGRLMLPFAPLTVTASSVTVAVTPWGSDTGIFATRDIALFLRGCVPSGHDAEHLAAVPPGPRVAVRHHAARGRDDRDTHPAQDP